MVSALSVTRSFSNLTNDYSVFPVCQVNLKGTLRIMVQKPQRPLYVKLAHTHS
jgi:hypothetical protein